MPDTDKDLPAIEWMTSAAPVDYPAAVAFMERRVLNIAGGTAPECVWLLEHPPLYTAGTSAKDTDLIAPDRFPVYKTGRGGQYTYHGPGQRVVYIMLNLHRRGPDIRAFVADLEKWLIASLARFNITARCHNGRIGVWVDAPKDQPGGEEKIAAIGIRVRKWVSFHGISLNVSPDLDHFTGIVPCGLADFGVTSMEKLGHVVLMPEVDTILRQEFERQFGATTDAPAPDTAGTGQATAHA